MTRFCFESPPTVDADAVSSECDRQLRHLIVEIVESAAAVGWRPEDILLSMVDISWEMYEERRSNRT
jgi:hypothetical protein